MASKTVPNKICFIICYNNTEYLNEAILYLQQLVVPEGYITDLLCIDEAGSMAEGYQAGMEESDAKYKVYMHQDVFILNKLFLEDTINIFTRHPETGMLGMVGTKQLPKSAVMWETKERIGALRGCTLDTSDDFFDIQNWQDDISYVMAVDGLLIMTQYDVPWRCDIFKGWDFYDVSQSFEFRRAGYKIAVPCQKTPWVMHDCGYLNMARYNEARQVFIKEYNSEF